MTEDEFIEICEGSVLRIDGGALLEALYVEDGYSDEFCSIEFFTLQPKTLS